MCEICEVNKKCDTLTEEMQFRIMQFQKELRFGNKVAADECRERALHCLGQIFVELEKVPPMIKKRDEENPLSSLMDLIRSKKYGDEPPIH